VTRPELQELIDSISLASYPMPLTLRSERSSSDNALEIIAELKTKERDSGTDTSVFCVEYVREDLIKTMPREAGLWVIHKLLKRIVLHELD